MGRSIPSYTKVFEDEIKRIMKIGKLLGSEYVKYAEYISCMLRLKRGLLAKDPNPSPAIDILYLLILELFKRVDACEGMVDKGISRYIER